MQAYFFAAALCGAAVAASPISAQDAGNPFGLGSASVTYGPYVRAELGATSSDFKDGNWLPPGQSDPRVYFDLGGDESGFGGIAFGYDWMNGFRADVGVITMSSVDATGPWSYTVPSVPGPHAEITAAPVRTTAMMGNLFYSPLEQRGVNSRLQPYFVVGLGIARNKLGDWTRENAASGNPVRTFAGNSSDDAAYSLGAGISWQATEPGQRPVLVDFSLRYFDFGAVEGGTTSLGAGGRTPREALNFTRQDTVVSVGVRVPLNRY
ncbi:hypothetical protein R5H32_06605 [Defluviimonas sp. D31]|uniref:outer membrane protein n=1 Tax=Defluviimonas sp. D31 TaxID=3083253 RepID=UPI00296FF975|nr:hypothetical protein [Defluviimonas sp. D31]MDW4549016.1 hypothetical protein [Defluviimonas sp. D31]